MKFTPLTKKIVRIVGILAGVLLLALLTFYLIFGRKPKSEHTAAGEDVFTTLSLTPFNEEDAVLDADLMKEYDYTVMEIWESGSTECIRYIGEMNMFAEECLHRDDEMYANVVGVCTGLNRNAQKVDEERLSIAKEEVNQEKPDYPQYIADYSMEKNLSELGIAEYPAVIFLNRQGRIVDIVSGMDGKQLCVHLDELIAEYMKEKKKQEREEK